MNTKAKVIIAILTTALVVVLVMFFLTKGNNDTKPETVEPTKQPEKVTIVIKFNTDGGNTIEDMVVTKGEAFNLPTPVKEGYKFLGWFEGETAYTDAETSSIDKDISLVASWEKIEVKTNTLKVTFDSRGGNKIDSMTFNCTNGAATLNNLPTPKKDSHSFMTWEDKFNTPILDGALITCEGELNLFAVWEKN